MKKIRLTQSQLEKIITEAMGPSRHIDAIIEAVEMGYFDWETVCRECLAQMGDRAAGEVAEALEIYDTQDAYGGWTGE
jgi:hypothetical protein